MKLTSFIATIVVFLSFFSISASAQLFDESTQVKYDTNYIKVYKDELTTRMFLSRKQNGYTLSDRLLNPWIRYKTNDNLLLGIGYTYSFLTLNLAVKMPFINRDDDIYGKSKYLDLQSHTIFRSYIPKDPSEEVVSDFSIVGRPLSATAAKSDWAVSLLGLEYKL